MDGQSDGRLPNPARTNESKRGEVLCEVDELDKLVASKQGCSWFRLRLLAFPDRTGAVQKADTNSWSARGVTSGQSRPIKDRASLSLVVQDQTSSGSDSKYFSIMSHTSSKSSGWSGRGSRAVAMSAVTDARTSLALAISAPEVLGGLDSEALRMNGGLW